MTDSINIEYGIMTYKGNDVRLTESEFARQVSILKGLDKSYWFSIKEEDEHLIIMLEI